jgi:hypothetical protein
MFRQFATGFLLRLSAFNLKIVLVGSVVDEMVLRHGFVRCANYYSTGPLICHQWLYNMPI